MVSKAKDTMYRYNLALPKDLFDELKSIADENKESVVDVLKDFIKLGLLARKAQKETGSALIIRREGEPDKHVWLP